MHMPDKMPRTFSAFTRFQMRLVGVDAKEIEGCPQRDIDMVTTLFWVMAGVWLWQSIVFALTLHMVLAAQGEWRLVLIGVALLLATIILLYDSYGIMMPSWTAHGLEELRRGGIDLQVPLLQRIANGSWLTLRLMAAVVTSIMITLFCSLQVFERDITEESLRFARTENKELAAGAETRFNRQLTDLDEDRARLAQNRDRFVEEEAQLRRRLDSGADGDPLLRPLADSVIRLETEKSEAEAALRQAESRAADELGGTRTAETTGIPGNGSRAQAARQRVQAARRALEAKAQELNEARAQLATTRDQRRGEMAQQANDAQTRLAELQGVKAEAEEKLKANTEERARLIGAHGKTINAEISLDPMRATAVTGFLGKVKALWRISGDPVVGFVTVLFDIFFFSIEMAAIVSKLATFVPSTYATRLARTEHFRAALEAQMLARDLHGLSREYEDSADTLELDEAPTAGDEPQAPTEPPQPEARKPAPPPTSAPASPREPKEPEIGKTRDIFTNGLNGSSAKTPETQSPGNGQMPPGGKGAPRKRGRPRGSKNRPTGDSAI